MRIQFGTGNAFFVPLTGVGANLPTPSSPRSPASFQDFTFENSATIKELRSQNQYPDDVAASDKKATWKIGFGRFDADFFNNLFAGEVAGTGGSFIDVQEAHNVPATNPTTITVTNAGTFQKDLGVTYTSTGQPFARVASGPAQGQYSVNSGTGVYTFALADAGVALKISYTYSIVTGSIVTVQNHPQGWSPSFEIYLAETYQELTANTPNYLHIYSAKCTKFSLPLKRADYLIADLEGECYSNAAGQIFDLYES